LTNRKETYTEYVEWIQQTFSNVTYMIIKSS